MENSYHNTNNEKGETLKASESKARTQEEKILEFMRERNTTGWTAHELTSYFPKWPITSTRRALTNLATKGKLKKTDQQRIGGFGKMTYVYELAPKQGEQLTLI